MNTKQMKREIKGVLLENAPYTTEKLYNRYKCDNGHLWANYESFITDKIIIVDIDEIVDDYYNEIIDTMENEPREWQEIFEDNMLQDEFYIPVDYIKDIEEN